MANIIDELEVCDDCAVAIANDDYSGMDDARAAAVRSALAQIAGYLALGDELGFCWRACGCCSAAAGNRHSAVILD